MSDPVLALLAANAEQAERFRGDAEQVLAEVRAKGL
jgi:hypothetical protein